MDSAAVRADVAFAVVAGRNEQADRLTASRAEFHGHDRGMGDASVSPPRAMTGARTGGEGRDKNKKGLHANAL
ncbi:hypothetical protein PT2222_340071 [Paraburkholderia tropica]